MSAVYLLALVVQLLSPISRVRKQLLLVGLSRGLGTIDFMPHSTLILCYADASTVSPLLRTHHRISVYEDTAY